MGQGEELFNNFYSADEYSVEEDTEEEKKCNVAGLSIAGDISIFDSGEYFGEVSSDDIILTLSEKKDNDDIKLLFIEINSAGGNPVAAEEIAEAIKRFNKPSVAIIREYGNSAAYWVASAADTIFASKNSDLGSIGVSGSYLDYSVLNEKDGLEFIDLSVGKFKDTGNRDKPLTVEEKELIMRDLNIIHENFIKAVAENRNLDIEKIRELADGSTMLGEMALQKGLIDKVGNYYDALDYLDEILGEPAEICWY